MKYKVGDKVRIKSLDWYNENKDEYGNVDINYDFTFYADRSKYCGKVFTISKVYDNSYFVKEDNESYYWTDEMIEGLVEEETKPNIIKEAKTYWDSIKDAWICPEGYIFKDENGNVINATKIVLEKEKEENKIILEERKKCMNDFAYWLNQYVRFEDENGNILKVVLKKKEYPKTFEECVHVLEGENRMSLEQMNTFRKLIDARNAYWKIYSEEMDLGKPWEPDWESETELKYTIVVDANKVCEGQTIQINTILAFPTEEMRDAFYENFKELIEVCKELL